MIVSISRRQSPPYGYRGHRVERTLATTFPDTLTCS